MNENRFIRQDRQICEADAVRFFGENDFTAHGYAIRRNFCSEEKNVLPGGWAMEMSRWHALLTGFKERKRVILLTGSCPD